MIWIQFLICAGLVVVVGSLLSRYADILAEKTGLGRSWVGGVLLAGATSLPELTTGISAVTVVGDVNLAAGGIMGSCLFNLLLIALLDVANGPYSLLRRVEISHSLAAGLGAILLLVVVIGMYLAQTVGLPSLGWVGLPTLMIILLYFVTVRLISRYERRRVAEYLEQEAEVYHYDEIPLWRAGLIFALLSAAILGLGLWLAVLGDRIIAATGLGASFVGAIFLAITTSLPEIVASFAALRIGAEDLAVSNIFGSNIFNIFALGIYDLVYTRGDMWAQLATIHAFAAVASALMTALAIVSLVYRSSRRQPLHISWDAAGLLLIYVGSMYIVYRATV